MTGNMTPPRSRPRRIRIRDPASAPHRTGWPIMTLADQPTDPAPLPPVPPRAASGQSRPASRGKYFGSRHWPLARDRDVGGRGAWRAVDRRWSGWVRMDRGWSGSAGVIADSVVTAGRQAWVTGSRWGSLEGHWGILGGTSGGHWLAIDHLWVTAGHSGLTG